MIPFFLAYFIEGKTVRSVVYGWLQSHIWEGSMRGIGPLRMLDRTFYLYFFACFFPVLFSPILFFSYFFSRIFFPVLFFPRMFFPYFFPYFFFRTSFRIFFLAGINLNSWTLDKLLFANLIFLASKLEVPMINTKLSFLQARKFKNG
jgi:hypothetical protein